MSELRTNRIVPRDGLPSGSSGGVIQVKSTTKTDTDTFTNTSYADVTGLSVSITPTRSDSKILIFVSIHGVGDTNTQAYFRFMRDSTPICVGDVAGARVQAPPTHHRGSSESSPLARASTCCPWQKMSLSELLSKVGADEAQVQVGGGLSQGAP